MITIMQNIIINGAVNNAYQPFFIFIFVPHSFSNVNRCCQRQHLQLMFTHLLLLRMNHLMLLKIHPLSYPRRNIPLRSVPGKL